MKVKLFKHIVTKDDIKIEESLQQFKRPSNIVSDNLNPIISEIKKILPSNPYIIDDNQIIINSKALFLDESYEKIAKDLIKIGFINFASRDYSNKLYTPQNIENLFSKLNQRLLDISNNKDLHVMTQNYINNKLNDGHNILRTFMISPDLNYIIIFYNSSKYKKYNEIISSPSKFCATYVSLNEICLIYNKTNESIDFKKPNNIIGDNFEYSYLKDLIKNGVYTGAPVSKATKKFLNQYENIDLDHNSSITCKFDEELFDWYNNNGHDVTSFYLDAREIIKNKIYVFVGEYEKPKNAKVYFIFDVEKNKIIDISDLKESTEFKRPENIVKDNLKINTIIKNLIDNGIYTDASVTIDKDNYIYENFEKYYKVLIPNENENLPEIKKLLNIKNDNLSAHGYIFNNLYLTSYLPRGKKYYRYILYDLYNKKLIYKNFLNESVKFKKPTNIVKDNTFYNKFIEKFGSNNILNDLKYSYNNIVNFLDENNFTNNYELFKDIANGYEPKNIMTYLKNKYNIFVTKILYSYEYNIFILIVKKKYQNNFQTIWFNIDSLINEYENFILNESYNFKRPENIIKDNLHIQNLKNKNIWTGNVFDDNIAKYMKNTNFKLYNTHDESDDFIDSIIFKIREIINTDSWNTVSSYIYELIPDYLYMTYYWDNKQWNIVVYDLQNNKIVE